MEKMKKFKCKVCGSVFEEEKRYLIHKKVHGRKSKVYSSDSFGDAGHAAGAGLVGGGSG